MSSKPRILSRTETEVSPWIRLVAKEVEFAPGKSAETYHSFAQADYISILAMTRGGLIPIVKQFRPAVEAFTYELPAGLVDPGEDAEQTCRRELKEETGLEAETVVLLGSYYTDTGRHENMIHSFFVRSSDPDPAFVPEEGLSIEFVTPDVLRHYIRSGIFKHQHHLGVLAAAGMSGYWNL